MGSDRKVRQLASRLIEVLRDEWDKIRFSVFEINCPFQVEMNQTQKHACNPRNVANCVVRCLADFVKCQAYMNTKTEINDAIKRMLILLDLHYTDYKKREVDTKCPK